MKTLSATLGVVAILVIVAPFTGKAQDNETGLATMTSTAQMTGNTKPATLCVYRPKHFVGFAVKPSVYWDGVEMVRLQNGTFFLVQVPAGKHMVTLGRSEVGLLIDFQPGTSYFLRFDHKNWTSTAASGRQPVFLTQTSEDEAKLVIARLKRVAVQHPIP